MFVLIKHVRMITLNFCTYYFMAVCYRHYCFALLQWLKLWKSSFCMY